MYYLNIENGVFSFLTDEIHDISESDIPISLEDYDEFFKKQSDGVQFKLRDVIAEDAVGLFDYVEEVPHETKEDDPQETLENLRTEYEALMERMQALENKLNA